MDMIVIVCVNGLVVLPRLVRKFRREGHTNECQAWADMPNMDTLAKLGIGFEMPMTIHDRIGCDLKRHGALAMGRRPNEKVFFKKNPGVEQDAEKSLIK
jgi:hypothetical protein